MKASVHWTGEVSFKAESETGHSVQMDGPPDQGVKTVVPGQWKCC